MVEIVALLTAVAVLVTALTTAITAIRTKRVVINQTEKLEEVHTLVNSAMTNMEARVAQLTAALEEAKAVVPPVPERAAKRKTGPT